MALISDTPALARSVSDWEGYFVNRVNTRQVSYHGGGSPLDWFENVFRLPSWIFSKKCFMEAFLRGFFDTDGSVYLLKHGIQISFTNYSYPLLKSLHSILFRLGYNPSKISSHKVYLTNGRYVRSFFEKICPQNPKHRKRFEEFKKMRRSYSGYYTRL